MSDVIKTVTIVTDNGPVRINHHEFDPKVHELHEGPLPEVEAPAAGNTTIGSKDAATDNDGKAAGDAAKPSYGVVALGSGKKAKFNVIDTATGAPIIGVEGIDVNGYASNAEAWQAINAVIGAPSA